MNITAHTDSNDFLQQHIHVITKLETHFTTPAITIQEYQHKTSEDLTISYEIH